MFFQNIFGEQVTLVLEIIYFLTIAFTVVLIIQQKGDPLKTISWLLVLFLLPVIGIVFYFFFGKNYRKEKIFSRKGIADLEQMRILTQDTFIGLPHSNLFKNKKLHQKMHIMRLLLNSSKSLVTEYNRVKVLNNGLNTFEAIFDAIENAHDHIHLEYYIIDDDKIGNQLRELLIRKANEGIKVRLIYDDVGCWGLPDEFIDSMTDAGIEVYPFLPVRFPTLTYKINYRNHRKIVVVDGKIGFVGGLNIADRYIDGNPEYGIWRDTHLQIEGEAVSSLQVVFLIDWFFVSDQVIRDEKYFITGKADEHHLVQITASGPDSDYASIMQAYFAAIASAQSSIYISSPYFLPNESILTALKTASLSGVDVRILLPARSDSRIVFWATRSYVTELLKAGINIYFYEKGFPHSKLLIVDGVLSSVGTANMDIRSFDQNFEVSALIYDEAISKELQEYYLTDLSHSTHITAETWENRPRWDGIRESVARIFSPLL
ncbi:MAG: cardiolipin synthase [Bacteroidales bacterium]|nr:cardiolipin synthase [Bacteroidales bacterium]